MNAVVPGLSNRQFQVLSELAADKTRKEIAVDLGITDSTVDYHVATIQQKLHAHTPLGAIMKAVKVGLVSLNLLLLCLSVQAAQVTLAWDASTDPAVNAYSVYWGVGTRNYTNHVDVPGRTNTSVTISNILLGVTYYFAATCMATNGLESDFSVEVSYFVPSKPNAPQNFRMTNVVLRLTIQQAVTPNGPWEDFTTLATTTGSPGFYRGLIAISPPAPAVVLPKRQILRSPKAISS